MCLSRQWLCSLHALLRGPFRWGWLGCVLRSHVWCQCMGSDGITLALWTACLF